MVLRKTDYKWRTLAFSITEIADLVVKATPGNDLTRFEYPRRIKTIFFGHPVISNIWLQRGHILRSTKDESKINSKNLVLSTELFVVN